MLHLVFMSFLTFKDFLLRSLRTITALIILDEQHSSHRGSQQQQQQPQQHHYQNNFNSMHDRDHT